MNKLAMAWMCSLQRLSNSVRSVLSLIVLLFASLCFGQEFEQFQGKRIREIHIQSDTPVDDRILRGLIELTPGVDIVTRSKIRKSIELLYATGNFTNVYVDATLMDQRVDLTFILRGVYRIERIDLDGNTGIRKGRVSRRIGLRKLEPYTPEAVLTGRDE